MEFNKIEKQPKNKFQVFGNTHKSLGYIDHSLHANRYLFYPSFEVTITDSELDQISEKIKELNK